MVTSVVSKQGPSRTMNLGDLVACAVIGVVFGIISVPATVLQNLLGAAFGPWGSVFVYGVHWVPGLVAGYVIRKPGAAFTGGIVHGVTQFLLGNPLGVVVLFFGISQATGTELGFAIFRYRRYAWWQLIIAGMFPSALNIIVVYFAFGLYNVDFLAWGPPTFGAPFISGPIGGTLAYVIAEALVKTGALRGFAIARREAS